MFYHKKNHYGAAVLIDCCQLDAPIEASCNRDCIVLHMQLVLRVGIEPGPTSSSLRLFDSFFNYHYFSLSCCVALRLMKRLLVYSDLLIHDDAVCLAYISDLHLLFQT